MFLRTSIKANYCKAQNNGTRKTENTKDVKDQERGFRRMKKDKRDGTWDMSMED
jgi:hypothetical protein